MKKERIDKLLVERGLAESRAKAQALVMAGIVLVNEKKVDKPSESFAEDAKIRLKGETAESKYVGRGDVGKGGIVKDAEKHREVVEKVNDFAESLGFKISGLVSSPILGADGNQEFLALYEA